METMHIQLIVAFIGGLAVGGFYFGGLWLTVRKCVDAKNPALFIVISFIVRSGGAMIALWGMTEGEWKRVAAALLGFIIVRKFAIYRSKRMVTPENAGSDGKMDAESLQARSSSWIL